MTYDWIHVFSPKHVDPDTRLWVKSWECYATEE